MGDVRLVSNRTIFRPLPYLRETHSTPTQTVIMLSLQFAYFESTPMFSRRNPCYDLPNQLLPSKQQESIDLLQHSFHFADNIVVFITQ